MDRGELLRSAEALSDPANVGRLNISAFPSNEAYMEAYVDAMLPQLEVELMGEVMTAAQTFGQWAAVERCGVTRLHIEAVAQCFSQLSDIFQREGFQTYPETQELTETEGPVIFHKLYVFWGPDAKEKWLATRSQAAGNLET